MTVNRILVAACLALFFAPAELSVLVALGPAAAGAEDNVDDASAHILALEKHRREAMVGEDIATLELLLAADATYTHSNGRVQTRDELLGVLVDGSVDYRSIIVSSESVRVYGTVAVVTGEQRIEVSADGQLIKSQSSFTSVYAVIDGDWKMVAYQSTPMRSRLPKAKTSP
jgi:hypothetical protein